jgi:hypothetical protein
MGEIMMKTKTMNHKMKAGIVLGVLLGTLIITSGITTAKTTSVDSENTYNKPDITGVDGTIEYRCCADDQYDSDAVLLVIIYT